FIENRRLELLASNNALQAFFAHQSLDSASGRGNSFSAQLLPDFANSIDLAVFPPHSLDLQFKPGIVLSPCRQLLGILLASGSLVIRRWGNRQHVANRLDPVLAPSLQQAPLVCRGPAPTNQICCPHNAEAP